MLAGLIVPLHSQVGGATPVEPDFTEEVVFSGLVQPTNIEFSPDGRVFVAEKRGTIKVFDDLTDNNPTTFADLRPVVHNLWDRGLLGLALHPEFPAEPWVYALYTYDAPPGETAPYWNDNCNSVPGGSNGGRCVVTARLSKLEASGNEMVGSEQVLIHDWCQQYPSHSSGSLRFGADGALYVSSGDGASFNTVDYGQLPSGGPINPCDDPPGDDMQPPTAEGGALRSQALTSTLSDPLNLDGAILRLDPDTGEPMPDNPLIGESDINRQRAVAHGVRNPYRITTRPGTSEVWIGDVGWNVWEEINRIADPTDQPANFGWPCYEGNGQMSGYANANLNLCSQLYSGSGQTAPHYTYRHSNRIVSGESCPTGTSAITGLAFYPESGGSYPEEYHGALFFADYARQCIWAMQASEPGGLPDPDNISTFVAPASTPVDLAVGPDGSLYWADIAGGTIRRIRYTQANTPPTAVIEAEPTSGPVPLTVEFDGTESSDPDDHDAGNLTYEWDFTDDGTVDATTETATFVYESAAVHTARLTVTDTLGASDSTTVEIRAGVDQPQAVIDTPADGTTWVVGEEISFSGHGVGPDEEPLPDAALHWELHMQHCQTPDDCHTHVVQEWDEVASGSFVAPDHEFPSWLELTLTVTSSDGQTDVATRELHPSTVDITMASDPSGLELSLGSVSDTTPFTVTVIQESENTISAPSPQVLGDETYTFVEWAHGGAQTHVISAPDTPTTLTAVFESTGEPPDEVTYEAEAPQNTLAGTATTRTLNNGTVVAGYLGDGTGNYLQFDDITADEAGDYPMTIHYVSGQARSATISVNGETPVELDFPATPNWQTVGQFTTTIALTEGANTIRITHPDEPAPDFDKIVITGGAPPPPPPPVSEYEAEAPQNTLAGSAVVRTLRNGAQVVGYLGDGTGNYLQVNDITADDTGDYPLTFHYVSGQARSATISVNGETPVELDFPSTGNWQTVGQFTTTIALTEGANTIRITHPDEPAPDFDKIVIGP